MGMLLLCIYQNLINVALWITNDPIETYQSLQKLINKAETKFYETKAHRSYKRSMGFVYYFLLFYSTNIPLKYLLLITTTHHRFL